MQIKITHNCTKVNLSMHEILCIIEERLKLKVHVLESIPELDPSGVMVGLDLEINQGDTLEVARLVVEGGVADRKSGV